MKYIESLTEEKAKQHLQDKPLPMPGQKVEIHRINGYIYYIGCSSPMVFYSAKGKIKEQAA